MTRLIGIIILVIIFLELAATSPAMEPVANPLGLEPGDLRLQNDDIGVILWGPNHTPTLSIGKSDVWDRRNPLSPEPVLTMAQIIDMARAGDPTILHPAIYYSAYSRYDFPCPKPVGQLILQFAFMRADGRISVNRDGDRAIQIRAMRDNKRLNLRIFVSAVRNLIVISGTVENLEQGDWSIRL